MHLTQSQIFLIVRSNYTVNRFAFELLFILFFKRHPQSGGKGSLSSADVFQTREKGSSDADVRIFSAKSLGIIKIYSVSTRTSGLSQCGHFADRGGVFFRDFVLTSFMDDLLTM